MCMNGQPRICSVLMLDLLAAAGVHLYYVGDFDPGCLLIAQKVKQYYKETFYQENIWEVFPCAETEPAT